MMMERHAQWMENAVAPTNIEIRIAVNTKEQAAVLKKNGYEYVLICGDGVRGVAPPAYALSSRLKANSRDIVVLASDDFFAPRNWDRWLRGNLGDYNGCLLVNDGYQYGGCVTIPIMTYECLKRLNHIIYHPEYLHLWSDAELFENLQQLKMLKNMRKTSPLFEHRHWANGKRKFDPNDRKAHDSAHTANQAYKRRMKQALAVRLKVGPKWTNYSKAAYLA
jgi:hypothetical protein